MKRCKNCGTQLNDDAKFCGFCGMNAAEKPEEGIGFKILISVLCVILFILINTIMYRFNFGVFYAVHSIVQKQEKTETYSQKNYTETAEKPEQTSTDDVKKDEPKNTSEQSSEKAAAPQPSKADGLRYNITVRDATGYAVICDSDISSVKTGYSSDTGKYTVNIHFTADGRRRFAKATANNTGGRLSFYKGKHLLTDTYISREYNTESVNISGDFGSSEAEFFAGSMPEDKSELAYWVRKSADDATSQVGAFIYFDNAKIAADEHGLNVYDAYGNTVYIPYDSRN